ncbi:AAA family ATPase [Ktedonobacter racemifer]|uniref:Uncharacterized protein n=1 Tax=Ktedonobacter racemifer DSM 44963 TaxID=485913 RepID=D6TNA7_KTERA|nr:AAA family ATPase [Ktedonobacter racemifer]EFH85420.1 hypothetical protein Krac_6640 [Ktedonobacter racemifer DSM 44963]
MSATSSATQLFARPVMPFTSFSDLAAPSSLPQPWIIQNLLPIGLTLLSGEPRCGKTSLAQQLMLDIATGTTPFGTYDPALDNASQYLRPTRGSIFYLSLTSSTPHLHEIRSRFYASRPDMSALNTLFVTNAFKPLTPTEGLQDLCDWIRCYADSCLLVIDDLAALRSLFPGNDRELLALLRRLAEEHQLSILLLHSCKRSSPLAAQVDQHLHLKRLPVSTFYQLEVLSNRVLPTSHLLHCPADRLSFRMASLEEERALETLSAHKTLTRERLGLLRLFDEYGSTLTPRQVAALLQLDYDCTRQILSKMVKANLLTTPARGRYAIHPFIKPLVPSLLAHHPFLPKFDVADIPAEEVEAAPATAESAAQEEKPDVEHTAESVIAHDAPDATFSIPSESVSPSSYQAPETPIAHNQPSPQWQASGMNGNIPGYQVNASQMPPPAI